MNTITFEAKATAQKQFEESIVNSENFIKRCQAIDIQQGKFLAVFPDIMMAVGTNNEGKVVFKDTPYTLPQAERYVRSVTNGHGKSPVVMSHGEYIQRCIDMQRDNIDFLRTSLDKLWS